MKLNPGDKAPEFKLPDASGNLHSLSDFAGKKAIVYFYPKAMTPGCTTQACDFRDNMESFTAKGAQLQGPALQHKGPLALIELRNGEGAPSYVAGTENFYVVTRYNWSSYYAMAVIELGQAVAERIGR